MLIKINLKKIGYFGNSETLWKNGKDLNQCFGWNNIFTEKGVEVLECLLLQASNHSICYV